MVHETSLSLLDRLQDPKNVQDWEFFVELYRPLIQRQLMRYSIAPEDSDDLSQETLLATYRSLPQFRHNGNPGAFRRWILTITHQRALNFLRRERRSPICSADLRGEGEWDIQEWNGELEAIWNQEHDEFLIKRILQLVEREFTNSTWLSFTLQVLRGWAAADTAKEAGISVNAALIAKSRVMRRLREVSSGLIEQWQT